MFRPFALRRAATIELPNDTVVLTKATGSTPINIGITARFYPLRKMQYLIAVSRKYAAIGSDQTFTCSLRLAEAKHYLISFATNARVENSSLMIVVRITKRITLRFEHEPGCFDLTFHTDRVNSMQRFGIPKSGASFGDMIDDQEKSPGLQCIEDSLVEGGNVWRPQK